MVLKVVSVNQNIRLTFCVETFPIASRPLWNLALSPSGHLLWEYMRYIGFAVVLVFLTLMSENFEISDHGLFFQGPGAPNRSYTRGNHRTSKTNILKFRKVNFYSNLNF